MNKAFTKEDVELEEDDAPQQQVPTGKNYITPAGYKALVDELNQLTTEERPTVTQTVAWAAGNGDRSENADYQYGKRRLREIDRRIHFLHKRIEIAEVVDPAQQRNKDQIFFGATVTFRNQDNEERTVTIVGVDEADLARGTISWVSPIAKALLKAGVDDVVTFQSPKGPQEIEILKISYL